MEEIAIIVAGIVTIAGVMSFAYATTQSFHEEIRQLKDARIWRFRASPQCAACGVSEYSGRCHVVYCGHCDKSLCTQHHVQH